MTLNLALRLGGITPTSSFTPTSIAGLDYWFDASDASSFTYSSGSVVSQWNDKSGNGYNLSQGTVANQPTRNATVNSLSAVTFDGSNDFMSNAAFGVATFPFTLFTVYKPTNLGSDALHSTSAAGGLEFRINGAGTFSTLSAVSVNLSTSTGTITAGSQHCIAVTHSLTDHAYFINGSAAGSGSGGYSFFGGGKLEVGSFLGGAGEFVDGVICELIRYNSVLGTTDRQSVESYLKTKWGTP